MPASPGCRASWNSAATISRLQHKTAAPAALIRQGRGPEVREMAFIGTRVAKRTREVNVCFTAIAS